MVSGHASAGTVALRIGAVTDPEIPSLTIDDLGILRDIRIDEGTSSVTVTITPTYSGCPAMEVIERDIVDVAASAGWVATVEISHNPPWTTDWISARGRRVLAEQQISPPGPRGVSGGPVPVAIGRAAHTPSASGEQAPVPCPRCGSTDTELISRFGTTACKALHRCRACGDPFDEFKAV